jgi:hypothetical protein
MERDQFELIKEIMDEIRDHMKYSPDDLEERLGRKKPKVEMVAIEGKLPEEGMEKLEEKMGADLDGDEEMDEPMDHKEKVFGKTGMDMGMDDEEMSPREVLKKRLMKLRA